jgi:hypothetical protein
LFLLFSAFIFVVIWIFSHSSPAECYIDSRKSFPSPDHDLVAVVENHKCQEGLGEWLPDWSEVYLVTERPVPLQVIPILTTRYEPPQLVWSAPDVLQLRVRWPRRFDPYVRNADGVRIEMRYDTAAWIDWEAKWDRYDMETGRYYIDGGLRVKLTPDPR